MTKGQQRREGENAKRPESRLTQKTKAFLLFIYRVLENRVKNVAEKN